MELYVECPHCGDFTEIIEINCSIFRHGSFKLTHQQLPPHAPKDYCDQASNNNLIYGCGKPFRLIPIANGKYTTEICDYI